MHLLLTPSMLELVKNSFMNSVSFSNSLITTRAAALPLPSMPLVIANLSSSGNDDLNVMKLSFRQHLTTYCDIIVGSLVKISMAASVSARLRCSSMKSALSFSFKAFLASRTACLSFFFLTDSAADVIWK